jgi:hypothetical protein
LLDELEAATTHAAMKRRYARRSWCPGNEKSQSNAVVEEARNADVTPQF